MDVNSVLQNTRQYFQGVPSSSPASGELAPGASVGYSSPPVSSTATSIAPSSNYPPYAANHFGQSSWNAQQSSAQNAYHQTSAGSPANGQPRFTQAVAPTPYHFYDNTRPPKALPSTSNSAYGQHSYTTPSITRSKEGGVNNQGMFNMDSIVCQQPNVANYAPGKKSKIKSSQSASSSANVYRQPTRSEEPRYFNSHHVSQPSPHAAQSGSTTATRVPAVMPHASVPNHHLQRPPEPAANHQSYTGHQSVIEHRVGFQQQVSYHQSGAVAVRGTLPAEKSVAQREPVDARYYVNRRLEATALQSAPAVSKRDSPLDLSVKTIRQSADSTALDDPENAMYNHHLQAGYPGHHMRPTEARHPHLPPQLPYANLATAAVTLPNVHNHSNNSAFSAIQRQHYAPVNAPVYPPEAPSPYRMGNGQLAPMENAALRHPVSEYRNEKIAFSFTYEQKQQMHRTQVNAQVSTVRFSQYYQPTEPKPNANGQPPYVAPSPQPKPTSNATSRKRRAVPESPQAPVKNPRVSLEWRENIDKEIESRLNACMKARQQESATKPCSEGYREPPQPATEDALPANPDKERDPHPKLPFTQYLEQHKAQHKLPVQPIHAYPHHQWYRQPGAHNQYPNMQPYKPAMSPRPTDHRPVYADNHVVKFNEANFEPRDLKIIEKVENVKRPETVEQKPLPPFRAFSMQPPSSPYAAGSHERDSKAAIERRPDAGTPPASRKADEESQSRAALMASALAHPRIRTKAELKQVTPMNKSKDKTSAETAPNKLPDAQNAKKVCRSQVEPQVPKSHSSTKGFSISESRHSGDSTFNHRPLSLPSKGENSSTSPESPSYTAMDLAKQSLPRKRSDSEPETASADLHSLNDMRKDRIKTRTPSVTPTNIDQMNEEYSDDSQWLEACDELIQQFSSSGASQPNKRTPKKPSPRKPNVETPSNTAAKKKPVADNVKDEDDTKDSIQFQKPIAVEKIKTETIDDAYDNPIVAAKQLAAVRVKKELFSDTEEEDDDEDDEEDEDEEEDDDDDDEDYEDDNEKRARAKQETKDKAKVNATLEIRGQRSNVSATRIRIQNSLEDSSSDSEDDFKSDFAPKKAAPSKPKVLIKKKKMPVRGKTKPRKKTKSKNIDPKREKMRHMILRRMETRKSKMDAKKAAKKVRSESVDDEPRPMMTRKMLRRECQKDLKTKPDDRKKIPRSSDLKTKTDEKTKKCDKSDDKIRPKLDRQSKEDKTKSKSDHSKVKTDEKFKPKSKNDKSKSKDKPAEESNKTKDHKSNDDKCKSKSDRHDDKSRTPSKKDDKNKKSDKYDKKAEPKCETKDKEPEDTTRSLRSRNVVVNENASPAKKPLTPKKPESPKEKPKSASKPVKKEDKKKSDTKDKSNAKPSWEEELFNYKYSLRMPVKLINIAKPPNWPKSNGGASSLPDLDRSESDSDLLNECTKPKTPKKKNKDETKVSNTKEFKDSVKILKEKFDKKIEEKNKATSLTQLMIDKKMKTIPKSSDGPELLPTPNLDSFRSKLNNKTDSLKKNDSRRSKDSAKNNDDQDKDEIVEDSLIGYFRKETVDVFKEVFEKHQVPNQFKTVILESRTRTQTKEMKHNATLKQVFGCDRPASAPPVTDSIDDDKKLKNSTNGCLKPWQKSFAKFKLLMEENCDAQNEKNSKDFEETVDFVYNGEDTKDNIEIENAVKKKSRTIRRKCRSSGFDYIRKKKKIKKEEDEEAIEERERRKAAAAIRPNAESVEDIQNEIRSWVVNKGIGETVLHKAARLGYWDISSYCLEKLHVSASPTDNAGYTPLHEACTRGHLKIAKTLLKHGADVSASAKGGIRPLHEAVEHGNIELVRLLLAYGADPLLSTYAGQTPLSLVKDDHDDLKDFLLLYLADIQGTPSKPWPFLGYDKIDPQLNGYDPLRDSPPPSPEQASNLEIEMSDVPLPNLYRIKNDPDLWVLCSDLPAKLRDSVTKRAQDQTPSQYVIKKLSRSEFDENVECASFLENKFSQKYNKPRPTNYTMIKYNDKLIATLNVQKLTLTFS